MDPKLSTLDPKLQDAYNRVMSGPSIPPQPQTPPVAGINPTPLPQQPAATQPGMNQPLPDYAPQDINQNQPSPETQAQPFIQSQQQPQAYNPIPQNPPPPMQGYPTNTIPGVNTTVAFNAGNNQKNQGTTSVKKGNSALKPILIGFGIIFLLAVYTFVWIILFNVKVPYLPQL